VLRPLSTDKRLLASVTALAFLVLLAACDDGPDGGPDENQIGAGDEYVALGDSYTAAPGTGELSAEDGCSQTVVNYPHLIEEATEVDLVDNSCNGANTSHLTTAKPGTTRGPQLDAIDEDTDLVTMRLGANDYNLIFRVFACGNPQRYGGPDAPGTPCADADAGLGANSVENRLPQVQDNLDRAVDDIEDRAPGARIILIGYPHVAPAECTCDLFPLPAGDYAYARRIIDGLNDAIESVADDHDLTYIDMEGPSEGHDTCSDDPWMAGIQAPLGDAAIWHPYPKESEMVAELVLEELDA
jgi:hypothetical protein